MALPPTYINFQAPAIDAGNLNAVNLAIYQLLGDGFNPPVTRLDVKTNLGIAADIAAADAVVTTNANAFATALAGRLIGVQSLTVSGNYTPTAGTTRILSFLTGGGGGGGGAAANGAAASSAGSGGNAGATSIHFATAGFSGQPFVIGAAGTTGAGASGGAGGATTFLGVSAPGGQGGNLGTTLAGLTFTLMPATSVGTGANILNGATIAAEKGLILSVSAYLIGGNGAPSIYGGQGLGALAAIGGAATGRGSGGGGASQVASAAALAGGAPLAGQLLIYEYS